MSKHDIEAYIALICSRQVTHGYDDAFRWKIYVRGQTTYNAQYGVPAAAAPDSDAVAQKKKARAETAKARRKKGKGKPKQTKKKQALPILELSPEPVSCPTLPPDWAKGLGRFDLNHEELLLCNDDDIVPTANSTQEAFSAAGCDLMLPSGTNQQEGHVADDYTLDWSNYGSNDMSMPMQYSLGTAQATVVPLTSPLLTSSHPQATPLFNFSSLPDKRGQHTEWDAPSTAPQVYPAPNIAPRLSTPAMQPAWMPTQTTNPHGMRIDIPVGKSSSNRALPISMPSRVPLGEFLTDVLPTSSVGGGKNNTASKKRKAPGPLRSIQPPPSAEETIRPRKRTKTNDDLAAEEAIRLTGGNDIRPRQRTTYKDMMILRAQMM